MWDKNQIKIIPLPYTYIFNIKNSIKLMEELLDIPFDEDLKFVLFDIKNRYSNIPIHKLPKIIEVMCKQNGLNTEIRKEIIKIKIKSLVLNSFFYVWGENKDIPPSCHKTTNTALATERRTVQRVSSNSITTM
jgi:hypothetical protein